MTPRVCFKSLGINHRWKKRNEIDKMLLLRPGDEEVSLYSERLEISIIRYLLELSTFVLVSS